MKNKKCKNEGCKSTKIWSKGFCRFHFLQEYPPKPIAKITGRSKIKSIEKGEYLKKQFALFEKHWDSKPHYCESCGKWLGNENNLCFHDHLLEKSKRKDIALNMENLILVCKQCHDLKTNGFPTEKHKEAILKAKQKFE